MSKVKTRKLFKHITFIISVILGMGSLFAFIDGGSSHGNAIGGGITWAVLSISYLACYFHVSKLLNNASK